MLYNGKYRSFILNRSFVFDAKTINDVLHLENEGDEALNGISVDEAKTLIFGENCGNVNRLELHHLTLEQRLMYWIYNHIIMPRRGSFSKFSDVDCVWLAYIMTGRRVNYGVHVMRHMVYHQNRSTLALCYAPLITLLMENAGIDLSNVPSRDLESHELLNDSTLSKMGYEFRPRSNSWVPKPGRRRRREAETEVEEEEEEGQDSQPEPESPPAGPSHIPQRFTVQTGFKLMMEQFAAIHTKIDSLSQRFDEHIALCHPPASSSHSVPVPDPTAPNPFDPMPEDLPTDPSSFP